MRSKVCLGLILLVCTSCETPKPSEETIDNVVRIFMHEEDHFSIMIQDPKTKVITIQRLSLSGTRVKFIPDAPNEKPMWAVARRNDSTAFYIDDLEFHVHSEKDLQGAGWDHGKHGRGQTQVVE